MDGFIAKDDKQLLFLLHHLKQQKALSFLLEKVAILL
jgi:hypothetical protein